MFHQVSGPLDAQCQAQLSCFSLSGQLVKVNVEQHSLKQQSLVQLLCHNILFDYFPTQAVYGINTTALVGPNGNL